MKNNKPLFITCFLTLTLLFAASVPQPVQAAGLGDILTSWITNIITGVIDVFSIPVAVVLMLLQAITGLLPVISGELFKAVMAISDTIPLIPTSGAEDMVSIGWRFTRDLANMFFIVILAWIGFATILRLESYEVKKILPKLVIIALLINFIPVICGVILDISSIFTNYFASKSLNIGALLWEKLPGREIAQGGTEGLLNLIPGQGGISGIAVKSLMGIIFNIMAFLILILYAIIFIVRIVAIWILLVLAPLAWLGYIIPQGQKMWSSWWKQFIQWSLIGIFLTFFLYLSGFVLGGTGFNSCNIDTTAVVDQYGVGSAILAGIFGENLICNALPFIAGIVIMLVGFMLSITFAPGGAAVIMKGAQRGGKAAGSVVGARVYKAGLEAPVKGASTYRQARRMGFSRRDAFGEMNREIKRTIAPKQPGALRDLTWRETVKKGTFGALRDSAKAGFSGATGIKFKKTGTKVCPNCKKRIAANAKQCPTSGCGYNFE